MAKLSVFEFAGVAFASAFALTVSIALSDPSEPELARLLDAPSSSISIAHRLCFAAIEADDEMLDQCLSEADQAVRG